MKLAQDAVLCTQLLSVVCGAAGVTAATVYSSNMHMAVHVKLQTLSVSMLLSSANTLFSMPGAAAV
jgi:hypothetical protein